MRSDMLPASGGHDPSILLQHDPRRERLRIREVPGVELRDRFRGALIGGAIGDALGRPNEGVGPREARARQIREYQPWHGWQNGPKGTITDDTQMTMWLAESILGAGQPAEAGGGGGR